MTSRVFVYLLLETVQPAQLLLLLELLS